jgi:PadR family transcriptional regulator PadR
VSERLEGWLEQLRRGGLDLAILATVSTGPRYGLSIIQHLEEFTDLVINEGTIYPILGRLTRQGLLQASWVQDESPHPRKYYRLTEAGRSALGAMQAEWRRFAGKIDRLLAAAQKESSEHDGP